MYLPHGRDICWGEGKYQNHQHVAETAVIICCCSGEQTYLVTVVIQSFYLEFLFGI